MASLEFLNLSNNRISEFNVESEDFPNLTHLKLKSNLLKSSCFFQMEKIENLEKLYLNENQIDEIPLMGDKGIHISMINLKILDLSKNPITVRSSTLDYRK
jgi:Leucine-rich repeat (LRR) protein